MIIYGETLDGVTVEQLRGGFFVGWPNPPAPEAHYRILAGSAAIVLARDGDSVVGFITAISDGVSAAFIPHLEVLPAYQGRGIGAELVRRMLAQLAQLYVVDLVCDPELQPFYARFGMQPWSAMVLRNYARQACDLPAS